MHLFIYRNSRIDPRGEVHSLTLEFHLSPCHCASIYLLTSEKQKFYKYSKPKKIKQWHFSDSEVSCVSNSAASAGSALVLFACFPSRPSGPRLKHSNIQSPSSHRAKRKTKGWCDSEKFDRTTLPPYKLKRLSNNRPKQPSQQQPPTTNFTPGHPCLIGFCPLEIKRKTSIWKCEKSGAKLNVGKSTHGLKSSIRGKTVLTHNTRWWRWRDIFSRSLSLSRHSSPVRACGSRAELP